MENEEKEKKFIIELTMFKDVDADIIEEKIENLVEKLNKEFDCEAYCRVVEQ